jgi:hypothetical protein
MAGGCFRVKDPHFGTLACSSWDPTTRTITLNGTAITGCASSQGSQGPFTAAAADGYDYFEVGAGNNTYAAFYWF